MVSIDTGGGARKWRLAPSSVHSEALAGATVFLHDEHADPLAELPSEARYSDSEQTTDTNSVKAGSSGAGSMRS